MTDGSILLVQFFDRKEVAYVRSAFMREGVISHPFVVSKLYCTPVPVGEVGAQTIKDVYSFKRGGVEYVLNNFSPLNIEVKDPQGNVLYAYTTGPTEEEKPKPLKRRKKNQIK